MMVTAMSDDDFEEVRLISDQEFIEYQKKLEGTYGILNDRELREYQKKFRHVRLNATPWYARTFGFWIWLVVIGSIFMFYNWYVNPEEALWPVESALWAIFIAYIFPRLAIGLLFWKCFIVIGSIFMFLNWYVYPHPEQDPILLLLGGLPTTIFWAYILSYGERD